jgi:hypothetical protein
MECGAGADCAPAALPEYVTLTIQHERKKMELLLANPASGCIPRLDENADMKKKQGKCKRLHFLARSFIFPWYTPFEIAQPRSTRFHSKEDFHAWYFTPSVAFFRNGSLRFLPFGPFSLGAYCSTFNR